MSPEPLRSSEPLLPSNGILLHIGPHKTGTTALQSAFETSRASLRDHGVAVTSNKLQRLGAAAATQRTLGGMDLGTFPNRRVWDRLCQRTARTPDRRVLVSSELFSDAKDPMVGDIVSGLGRERVRVLITVRPLEKLLPSTWQQGVKNGAPSPYDRWLHQVLKGPESRHLSKSATKFWSRHDHATLLRRWADVVGLDKVAVLIVNESEPEDLLRNAEMLIGVPAGTLQAGARRNRSLTAEEAEVVRQLYLCLGDSLDRRRSQRWIHRGAVTHLVDERRPPADEPRLVLPFDSVVRAREIGQQIADRLFASGVRIVGDPKALLPDTPIPTTPAVVPTRNANDVAVKLLEGLFLAAKADSGPSQAITQLSSRQLLTEAGHRVTHRVRRQGSSHADHSANRATSG